MPITPRLALFGAAPRRFPRRERVGWQHRIPRRSPPSPWAPPLSLSIAPISGRSACWATPARSRDRAEGKRGGGRGKRERREGVSVGAGTPGGARPGTLRPLGNMAPRLPAAPRGSPQAGRGRSAGAEAGQGDGGRSAARRQSPDAPSRPSQPPPRLPFKRGGKLMPRMLRRRRALPWQRQRGHPPPPVPAEEAGRGATEPRGAPLCAWEGRKRARLGEINAKLNWQFHTQPLVGSILTNDR